MSDNGPTMSVRYTRDFLLSFKDKCTDKPTNLLADLDAIFGPTAIGPKKNFREGRKSAKKKKGDKKDGKPKFAPPNLPELGSALQEDVKLEKSENRWVPSIQSEMPDAPIIEAQTGLSTQEQEELREKEEEANVKKARGILNKLTPERFDRLFEQFACLPCETESMLEKLADAVFRKALDEQAFSSTYAELAQRLMPKMPTFPAKNEDGEDYTVTFHMILVNKCEEKFFAPPPFDEVEDIPEGEERDEKLGRIRRHIFGNVKFISELFKLKIIPDKTMHEWVMELLNLNPSNSTDEPPSELDVEQVAVVLTNVGSIMDNEKGSRFVKQYFDTLKGISNDKKNYSARIRFMVQDLLDLRRNSWIPRRDAVVNPQTLEEVRAEVEQKEKQEAEKMKEAERKTPSGFRRADSWFGGGKGVKTPASAKPGFTRNHSDNFSLEERRPQSSKTAAKKGGRFGDDKWKPAGRDHKPDKKSSDDGWHVKGDDWNVRSAGKKRAGGRGASRGGRSGDKGTPFGSKGRGGGSFGHSGPRNSGPSSLNWRKEEPPKEVRKQNAFSLLTNESEEEVEEEHSDAGGSLPESTPETTPEKSTKKLDFDAYDRKAGLLVDEYLSVKSEEEAQLSLTEFRGFSCDDEAAAGPYVVFKAVYKLMDEGERVLEDVCHLLDILQSGQGGITPEEIEEGIKLAMRDLEDLSIDLPLAPKISGRLIGRLIHTEVLSVDSLLPCLRDITEFGASEKVLISTLAEVQQLQGSEELQEIISRSTLRLLSLFRPGTDEETARKALSSANEGLAEALKDVKL